MTREDFVTPAHQRVPDADAAILGSTGQVAALWVYVERLPAQTRDPFGMASENAADLIAGGWVPEKYLAVFAA